MVLVAVPEVSVAVGESEDQALVRWTLLSATQVMVGGVWSSTVTVWLQSAVLPQASVARHVRVASKVLPQWTAVLVSVLRSEERRVGKVSRAVGGSKDQAQVHSTLVLGMQVMEGGV